MLVIMPPTVNHFRHDALTMSLVKSEGHGGLRQRYSLLYFGVKKSARTPSEAAEKATFAALTNFEIRRH